MKLQSQRAPFMLGAAAALMLTFSTAAVYPQVTQQTDPTPTPAAPSTGSESTTPAQRGDKGAGRLGSRGDNQQYLADALGISGEDLLGAYLTAATAALDQAVEQDLLTQTQADNLRTRLESAAANGFGFRLGGRGLDFLGANDIDGEALLAEALGISVDELQAAYDEAETSALAQAVTDGQLTQEQADLVAARQAFREYVRSQQQSYEELVQVAVDAGAITQTQADLLLANQQSLGGRGFGMGGDFGGDFGLGRGMGGRGMDGGRGMHGGHGMFDGQGFGPGLDGSQPDSEGDDTDAQSNSSSLLPSAGL